MNVLKTLHILSDENQIDVDYDNMVVTPYGIGVKTSSVEGGAGAGEKKYVALVKEDEIVNFAAGLAYVNSTLKVNMTNVNKKILLEANKISNDCWNFFLPYLSARNPNLSNSSVNSKMEFLHVDNPNLPIGQYFHDMYNWLITQPSTPLTHEQAVTVIISQWHCYTEPKNSYKGFFFNTDFYICNLDVTFQEDANELEGIRNYPYQLIDANPIQVEEVPYLLNNTLTGKWVYARDGRLSTIDVSTNPNIKDASHIVKIQ